MQNDNREKKPDYSMDAVLNRITKKEDEGNSIKIPGWVVLAAMAAICFGIWHWYQGLGVADIPLCVVNTSSDSPMKIYLDGKFIDNANRMISEDTNLAVMAVLKPGRHKLEAKDRSDTVIESESITVEEGSNGFLWTPLRDPSAKFIIQTTYYGEAAGSDSWEELHPTGHLNQLPKLVSYWFKDNPSAVSVPAGWKSTHERALRLKR